MSEQNFEQNKRFKPGAREEVGEEVPLSLAPVPHFFSRVLAPLPLPRLLLLRRIEKKGALRAVATALSLLSLHAFFALDFSNRAFPTISEPGTGFLHISRTTRRLSLSSL